MSSANIAEEEIGISSEVAASEVVSTFPSGVEEGVEEEEMTSLLLMWVAHRQVRVGWNNDPLETNLRIDI